MANEKSSQPKPTEEPKVIAERICWPAPRWSVEKGLAYFREMMFQDGIERQLRENAKR